MTLNARIEQIIGPAIETMGFDLVRIQIMGQKRLKLQVMIEHLDGTTITVDNCANVSRAVSAILDVEDPIKGEYTLEVGSPGIDRPLVKPDDFNRFVGLEAKVELARLLNGCKRFRGRLAGYAAGEVRILVEGEEVTLPFEDIHSAKLVLTDDLLAASAERTDIRR